MGLRETLEDRAKRRARAFHRAGTERPSVFDHTRDNMIEAATAALESLSCRCSPEARAASMERYACDRCARLAELTEGR